MIWEKGPLFTIFSKFDQFFLNFNVAHWINLRNYCRVNFIEDLQIAQFSSVKFKFISFIYFYYFICLYTIFNYFSLITLVILLFILKFSSILSMTTIGIEILLCHGQKNLSTFTHFNDSSPL